MLVGVHVSIYGGILKAINRIKMRGGNIFQIFTRSPRSWGIDKMTKQLKPINIDDVNAYFEELESNKIELTIDHMPYIPNLASPEEKLHSKSTWQLAEELKRCETLRIPYLVTHLGSHKGEGLQVGQKQVVKAIDAAMEQIGQFDTKILLENTSGGTNSVGNTFEEIAAVLNKLADPDKVGICFDTCHAFAAGYDLTNASSIEKVLEEFDTHIGLDKLQLVHANDSKYGLGDHRDNHWHIGQGKIGIQGFDALVKQLPKNMPYIAETPGGKNLKETRRLDKENIGKLKHVWEKYYA